MRIENFACCRNLGTNSGGKDLHTITKFIHIQNVDNVDNVQSRRFHKLWETTKNGSFVRKTGIMYENAAELCQVDNAQRNPHAMHRRNVYNNVDNVDNLFFIHKKVLIAGEL